MQQKVESGVQLFSRLGHKYSLKGINPALFPEGDLDHSQTIEVVTENGVHTSDLFIDFIARCILPSKYNSEWQNCGVILVNTEFQVNLFRIIKVLSFNLKKCNVKNNKQIIEACLKNLTILDCFNKEQFVLTLHNLDQLLQQKENVALLIVDNISSYYWIEKMSKPTLSLYGHSSSVLKLMTGIVKNLNLVVLFSRSEKVISPRALSSSVNHKIMLGKVTEEVYKLRLLRFETNSDITINYTVDTVINYIT